MNRLLLKALTVCLGYSLVGQSLRLLYPFFSHQVLIVGVLLLLITASIASLQWDNLPRTELYILLFWATIGLAVGLA